jgi:hypothetical protein
MAGNLGRRRREDDDVQVLDISAKQRRVQDADTGTLVPYKPQPNRPEADSDDLSVIQLHDPHRLVGTPRTFASVQRPWNFLELPTSSNARLLGDVSNQD